MNFVSINGLTLHYHLQGDKTKPALVFLNALGSDFRIWHKVIPAFENDYQIVRYDKRGHGLSDAPAPPYVMREHSDDLMGLLEHLGLPKVILIGLSVGGMIALDVAATYPQQVSAMVLSDTGMKLGTAEFWNDRINKIRADGLAAHADAILERWFTKNLPAADKRGYHNMLSRTPEAGYTGTCEAIRDADLRAVTANVHTPTLVLTGSEDQSTPVALGRALADSLPRASFHIIESAAHFPCIEQPEETVKQIKTFLRKERY